MTRHPGWFLGAVALQFAILSAVIAYNQFTVWTGETVLLRVEPVDPRDLFRGDYVSVRYTISRLDLRRLAGGERLFFRGDRLYVELAPQADGFWQAVAAFHERRDVAAGHALLRGAVTGDDLPERATISYGIEDVFIPEGRGPAIEQASRTEGRSVSVEIAVDRYGRATVRRLLIDGQPLR